MSDSIELTAELVAAYVSNNPLPKNDLPDLILAVHSSLEKLRSEPEPAPPQAETKPPAVPIRRSVTPDYLICLEDGKRFKSLRRHLREHGLTPEQYRVKWKLPSDYLWSHPTTRPSDRLWRESSDWVGNGRRVDSPLHLSADRFFGAADWWTRPDHNQRMFRFSWKSRLWE